MTLEPSLPGTVGQEMESFFRDLADRPADGVVRSGERFAITIGHQTLHVEGPALEAALREGRVAGDTLLMRSLLAYESALNAYLRQSVARAILKAFADAVHGGTDPAEALQLAYYNVVLAYDVEAYVNTKTGLAQDIRHVAEFTQEATAAGTSLDAGAIGDKQQILDSALNQFMDAVAAAQSSGNYEAAFDAQQQFFVQAAAITETDYWRNRAASRSRDVALAETAGAIARTRVKLSHLAEAVAAGN